MKGAEVRKDGAGKGGICWPLGEIPQLRRDAEQSSICYEDAYHGEGGRVMLRTRASDLPRHADDGTEDVPIVRGATCNSLRPVMELLRYRVQGRLQVMPKPCMGPCHHSRQGLLAYPRC